MTEKTPSVQLKLAVYRSQERLKLINLASLDETEAYGFDLTGKPVMEPNRKCYYKFTGGHVGNVHLNYIFKKGLNPDNVTEPNSPKRVFGFEALSIQLGRNGAYADPKKIEQETSKLIKEGVSIIHYVKLSSLLGMQTFKKDEWMVTGKAEQPDYDVEWQKMLKDIKSEWRIATPKMEKSIHALNLRKTLAAEPEI